MLNKEQKVKEVQEDLKQFMPVTDSYITAEIKKENPDQNIHQRILRSILHSYRQNQSQKRKLKLKFFAVVMAFYALVIFASICAIFLIPLYCKNSYIAISSILGAIISLVTTVLKIPKIIAEYLFPKDEDNIMVDMSKNVLLHDERTQLNQLLQRTPEHPEENEN